MPVACVRVRMHVGVHLCVSVASEAEPCVRAPGCERAAHQPRCEGGPQGGAGASSQERGTLRSRCLLSSAEFLTHINSVPADSAAVAFGVYFKFTLEFRAIIKTSSRAMRDVVGSPQFGPSAITLSFFRK